MPTKKELEEENAELKFMLNFTHQQYHKLAQRERTNKHRAETSRMFMWMLYKTYRSKGLSIGESRNLANEEAKQLEHIKTLKSERWLIQHLKDDMYQDDEGKYSGSW